MSLGLTMAGFTNQNAFPVDGGDPLQVPPQLANIYRWHRAEEDNMTLEAGDKVSQWDDLSGHDNHLIQTSDTNRPTFIATTGSFNGQSCVQFDGVDNYMFDVHTALSGSGITFGIIFRKNKAEGLVDGILALYKDGALDYDSNSRFNYNTGRKSPASLDDEFEIGPSTGTGDNVFLNNASSGRTDWVIVRADSGADTIKQILTGSVGVDQAAPADWADWDIDRCQIGARMGNQQQFRGDYLEIIVYQSALSDDDMFALDNYLSSSLAGTLSGSA